MKKTVSLSGCCDQMMEGEKKKIDFRSVPLTHKTDCHKDTELLWKLSGAVMESAWSLPAETSQSDAFCSHWMSGYLFSCRLVGWTAELKWYISVYLCKSTRNMHDLVQEEDLLT